MASMLRTELCDVLGIDAPIIQAGMSVHTSPALVVAVSQAGGLGSLGAWGRSTEALRDGIRQIRDSSDAPFAVNHLPPDLDEESFAVTLGAAVPVISFATGNPGDLVARAHDAGSLVTVQVTTVQQAEQAAGLGVDVVIAQGGEAGGYGGEIATTVLVPQVVRRVTPVPVVAAGGFVDGSGLVAALAFGACGVSIGTRFLATLESPIHRDHLHRIVNARGARRGEVTALQPAVAESGCRWIRHRRSCSAVAIHRAGRGCRGAGGRDWPPRTPQSSPTRGHGPRAGRGCRTERRPSRRGRISRHRGASDRRRGNRRPRPARRAHYAMTAVVSGHGLHELADLGRTRLGILDHAGMTEFRQHHKL